MKKRIWGLAAVCALLLVLAAVVYLSGVYDASESAVLVMEQGLHDGHAWAFVPDEMIGGLVFYPGGLVDYRAYAPLMQALRERGVLSLLVEMPLHLAVLDMKAADGLQERYPDVDRWLIGGHSLGGAMAAGYVADHAQEYEGLVLLGAYSTADLSDTALSILSVYGTQDGVLNREKYDKCLKHYPDSFTELVIDGGCHAYFGDYGAQKGDGAPVVSREQQIQLTADAIAAMLKR